MNVVSLYVTTCRLVLQARANDASSWSELNRLIPQLRSALSCSVCSQLVSDPMSPEERIVDVSNQKTSQVTCRECLSVTDHLNYVQNECVRILLLCFKKLCEYIVTGSLYRKHDNDASSNCVTEILLESIGVKKNFESNNNSNGGHNHNDDEMLCVDAEDLIDVVANGNNSEMRDTLYSVMFANNHRTKITIKRNAVNSSSSDSSDKKFKRTSKTSVSGCRTRYNRAKIVLKKGCRCGNATLTPGKLTCCGQRCPCYVNGKSCFECKCKGCRNPHKKQNNNNINNISNETVITSDEKNTDTSSSDIEVF